MDDIRIHRPPQTLREMALERLRSAIIAGRFPSGARLVERTLCDQLGVSRSVVREVIRILEAEGLVVKKHNTGYNVAPQLSGSRFRDIYEFRLLIEPAAAAAAALLATPSEVAALAELCNGNGPGRQLPLARYAQALAVGLAQAPLLPVGLRRPLLPPALHGRLLLPAPQTDRQRSIEAAQLPAQGGG